MGDHNFEAIDVDPSRTFFVEDDEDGLATRPGNTRYAARARVPWQPAVIDADRVAIPLEQQGPIGARIDKEVDSMVDSQAAGDEPGADIRGRWTPANLPSIDTGGP